MRVNNVEPMRSMDEGWKGTVLLLLCSLLQGAWERLLQLLIDVITSFLSDKWNSTLFVIMGWLHCSLSFSLLYSSLMCLHGTQSSSGSQGVLVAVDFVIAEGHLATNDV